VESNGRREAQTRITTNHGGPHPEAWSYILLARGVACHSPRHPLFATVSGADHHGDCAHRTAGTTPQDRQPADNGRAKGPCRDSLDRAQSGGKPSPLSSC
jgi:hypothetical protein